jgi:NAD(P)H-flavin reductase
MKREPLIIDRDPWNTQAVRIVEIVPEIENVATYLLKYDDTADGHGYDFIPGQFNMLYLPGVGESAISMSGRPDSPASWYHTVRVAGNVTHTLAQLKKSDTLGLRGPFGTGWPISELKGADVVIVAGGLGMAPLRPIVYHIMDHRSDFGRIWLIYGSRTPETLLYADEYDEWQSHEITMQVTVDRATPGWTGNVGVVTLLIERLQLPRAGETHILACGPEVMMKYSAISALRQGIRPDRIWMSMERNMQCAVGLCGHCQLGPDFICKDGPVLRYDRFRHYLNVEHL